MRRVLALVLAVGVLTVACGLPQDDGPRPLAVDAIPFDLLAPSTTAPAVTGVGPVTVSLFFLGPENRLLRVPRRASDKTADTVIKELLTGVLEGEGTGVSTAIPPETRLLSTHSEGSVLVIELSPEIFIVQGPGQNAAFAQLVWTASAIDGVFGVQFIVNGQLVSVPTDTGAQSDPVYEPDFNSLRPEG